MAIILHGISGSPFTWCVQLALEHKGIDYTARWLNPGKGDLRAPEFLALNPNGKVPVLEHDGFALFESGAIGEYLEEAFPGTTSLLPGDARARALVRRRVLDVHTEIFPHGALIVQNVYFKPQAEWDLAAIEQARAGLAKRLEFLESDLGGAYRSGDALTLADCALYPQLAHVARYELRKPDLALSACVGPKTRAWMGRIEAQPYFDRTYPSHWR